MFIIEKNMYFIGYLSHILILTTHKETKFKTEIEREKNAEIERKKFTEIEPNKNDSLLMPEAIPPWEKIWD